MDKLSLYEILSFVVPGFVAVQLFQFVSADFSVSISTTEWSVIKESLVLFSASLFFGILIHFVTLECLIKVNIYKTYLYQSTQEIASKNPFLTSIIPFLNDEFYKSVENTGVKRNDHTDLADNLFDFAYYDLELKDKITPAKNFQSIYFGVRNIFTLGLGFVLFILYMIGKREIGWSCCVEKTILYKTLICSFIVLFTSFFIARWLRKKMVEKVLWGFYVERVNQNK